MRFFKRILAVVVICLTVLILSYLIYTGSKLNKEIPQGEKIYELSQDC